MGPFRSFWVLLGPFFKVHKDPPQASIVYVYVYLARSSSIPKRPCPTAEWNAAMAATSTKGTYAEVPGQGSSFSGRAWVSPLQQGTFRHVCLRVYVSVGHSQRAII